MKLSPAMKRAILNLHEGRRMDHGVHGMSAHGGFTHTIFALHKRKLLDRRGEGLSDLGKEVAVKLSENQK